MSLEVFWSEDPAEVRQELGAREGGLSSGEAAAHLQQYGRNTLGRKKRLSDLQLLLSQFRSPIILILLAAAILSAFLGDKIDTIIIGIIILLSGLLSFWQERGATRAVEALVRRVIAKTTVVRDGREQEVPTEEVVPGDESILTAGSLIPGDSLLLDSQELFVDESALTGETFPVEKQPGKSTADAALSQRAGALFMGTHVVSGSGRALVVRTGRVTVFGQVAQRLAARVEETGFERGVRQFGYFLLEVTLMLVITIFAINVYLHKPVLDSFLFSLALAVGLTPQLLPAIISVNLAQGARRMADRKVIVKRLDSIEDFGSMDVLCSDKTGTLTEGRIRLKEALDLDGKSAPNVLELAAVNASFETGFRNPIDEAIRQASSSLDLSGYRRLDEEPYDFVRKRLSVLARRDGRRVIATKGSLSGVLAVCDRARRDGKEVPIDEARAPIEELFERLSREGYRTLGVAYRDDFDKDRMEESDEESMVFAGLLALEDTPKQAVAETVAQLRRLGVRLKMITGDNQLVARSVAVQSGLPNPRVLVGSELGRLSNPALVNRAKSTDVFAEIEPNQKERIIHALHRAGNIVGYLGDGINDAPALHAADVGISVDSAVDVAKEAADIVLLEHSLGVLCDGVTEGRKTFANTLKYVFMATSANFGNMFSVAGASLFLPYLPLLPTQILLTNLLTDLPETTIASDQVDPELVQEPRRWDIHFIREFMLVFGPLSSVFDYLTFGVLLLLLHAGTMEFRTGWFVESVISASMIVLVIRTRRSFWSSRPSKYLAGMTVLVALVTIAIPYTPLGPLFHFTPLPPSFLAMLFVVLVLYVAGAEVTKRVFYRHQGSSSSR